MNTPKTISSTLNSNNAIKAPYRIAVSVDCNSKKRRINRIKRRFTGIPNSHTIKNTERFSQCLKPGTNVAAKKIAIHRRNDPITGLEDKGATDIHKGKRIVDALNAAFFFFK